MKATILAAVVGLLALDTHVFADPMITSWYTQDSTKYARIYTTDANKASGTSVTAWSNGTENQTNPAYCGVQEIYSSSSWVYIRSTGLANHIMGPWYLNAAHTQTFPNDPANQHVFYRFPRASTVPSTKTLTGLGAIGYFVDGVAMFDSRDGYYWNGSAETSGGGTGYWNREAYVNESVSFDPGYAHQEQTGTHHYHANPIALRYVVGDHVDFNATTKAYSESTNAATKHSPILGWVRDGYPIYGPYGYSNATNAASGIRRMISGFVLRNGQMGTQNLTVVGRTNIPPWAVRLYNVSAAQSGPAVSTTYPLDRYMEDNDYLGDLGYTQGVDFDLDEYNGRFCVTPEFPSGTYAYFVAISSNGTPVFPYNIGRAFYGNPTGAAVTSLSESVTTNYFGGPNTLPILNPPAVNNGSVTLTWSALEGGTYRVEAASALNNWATNASGVSAVLNTGSYSDGNAGTQKFYRVSQTALAAYDAVNGSASSGGTSGGITSVSPTSGNRGTNFTLTINIDANANPAPPPATAPINSVTIGAITGASNVHVNQTQVTSSITIPANATTGPQTVTIVFPGPPGNPTATVTYTLTNGFTIN